MSSRAETVGAGDRGGDEGNDPREPIPTIAEIPHGGTGSTTTTVGGVTFQVKAVANHNIQITTVATEKEKRHTMKESDLEKFKTKCTAPDILKQGELVDHVAASDQASIQDIYDATQIINEIREHLQGQDMLTCFTIIEPALNPSNNQFNLPGPHPKNLFKDHANITYQEIETSINYFLTWVYQDHPEGKWVESDLSWSGQFLFQQMSVKLCAAIKDDIKDKRVAENLRETGPIVFKALIDRMMNSNYNALRLLKSNLKRENISLDDYDGDIEDFAKKYLTLIDRLRKCEEINNHGKLVGREHVPEDLSESLLLVLSNTGHRPFDLIFETRYAKNKTDTALEIAKEFEPPETILEAARKLYVSYRNSGDWDAVPGGTRNPSGFLGAARNKRPGKCFGCGRDGCRHTERFCSRFGKDPNSAGKAAKQEFETAKQQKKSSKSNKSTTSPKSKWPPKPKKGERSTTKIDGVWHYYHFKSKKWLRCNAQHQTDLDKKENDKKATSGSDSQTGPSGNLANEGASGSNLDDAALLSLMHGKEDLPQAQLERELFLKQREELEKNFKAKIASL